MAVYFNYLELIMKYRRMKMEQRLEEIKKCDKLINSFLLRGNKFVEYAYLCNYAHCNYSILDCYLDENNMFTLSGKKMSI